MDLTTKKIITFLDNIAIPTEVDVEKTRIDAYLIINRYTNRQKGIIS
jgi:hypothetical protein